MKEELMSEGRIRVVDRQHLPPEDEFKAYRKTDTTLVTRVMGEVKVVTREGVMSVRDPWIAIDANGWPYPIADDVFQKSYEPVESPLYEDEDEE
jgi:hypothetical protein